MSNDWPFDDPPNVAVFTTTQVIRDAQPILYVSHDEEDGAWQFHTGDDHVYERDAMVVSLSEILDYDSSIRELHDLPYGWIVTRPKIGASWVRTPRT